MYKNDGQLSRVVENDPPIVPVLSTFINQFQENLQRLEELENEIKNKLTLVTHYSTPFSEEMNKQVNSENIGEELNRLLATFNILLDKLENCRNHLIHIV